MLTDPHCPFSGGDFRRRSNVGWSSSELEIIRAIQAPGITHLGYRVIK